MMKSVSALPALSALPELISALEAGNTAILSAPPGSGKTTCLPQELLKCSFLDGKKIIMLEPRRAAARAAARRIAFLLGEKCGNMVGWRVKNESEVSASTRIEIVTEGILVRKIQNDPELREVGLVIFDEFHERSLFGDLSLALTLDVRKNFHPDLKIMVMSATIDTESVSSLLDNASQIIAEGKIFPVETRYADIAPAFRDAALAASRAVLKIMNTEAGSALVFLPGAFEINTACEYCMDKVDKNVHIYALYGALDKDIQDSALSPTLPGKRKIVFATNLAESSLTIEGVRIVVDSGLEKVPRFDPSTGLTHLETAVISKASANQRRGRAGRTCAGIVMRMWREIDEIRMADFPSPEILTADLSNLLLELANWGSRPEELSWLTPPPEAALNSAEKLLKALNLFDSSGKLTKLGREAALLPLHPRLGAMLVNAKKYSATQLAAEIAVIIEEKPLTDSIDLTAQIQAFRASAPRNMNLTLNRLLRQLNIPPLRQSTEMAGVLTGFAYPDRIARQRIKHSENYLTSDGRGAKLPEHNDLKRYEFLAISRLDGADKNAVIRLAAPITLEELKEFFPEKFTVENKIEFNREKETVFSTKLEKFGALTLKESPDTNASADAVAECLLNAVCEYGLRLFDWTQDAVSLRERVNFAPNFPDWSDHAMLSTLNLWLQPYILKIRSFAGLKKLNLFEILRDSLGYTRFTELNRDYPEKFTTPAGSKLRIDYSGSEPKLSAKIQEFYGCNRHPTLGNVPLLLELLSPAMRPIQTTSDLPNFWHGNWELVKKEMKGRYPKHLWPDNPAECEPTTRAKQRKK